MKSEMDTVDWYIAVFEAGKNSKYIIQDYMKQKKELEEKIK